MERYGLISEQEAIFNMLVEKHNQLRSLKVTERLMQRRNLKGLNENEQRALGAAQKNIKELEGIIVDLLEFLKEAKAEPELAKTLEDILPLKKSQ